MVPHHEAHLAVSHLHLKLHRLVAAMAQGVVQQVAQRRHRQRGGHAQVDLRSGFRQAQHDAPVVTTAGILHRLPGHLLGAALHAILERQAALHPRQQQQLLQGPVQPIGALFGMF
ncbi:hypothetical protein D3C75_1113520 [compost metagenome]